MFDFINKALDKVVGTGKKAVEGTKQAASTFAEDWKSGASIIKGQVKEADKSYNDFMNTKVAPKAAKVGEVVVDTAGLIARPVI